MKKLYKTLGCVAVASLAFSAGAQQLPNAGFESWKTACGSTEAFGYTTGMLQRPGIEPTGWNGSSVNQKVIFSVKKELITQESSDIAGGSYSVKMTNAFVGMGTMGDEAPGFVTLGSPWVYANTTVADCDGGTYGGVEFTYKPDAITGKYKRTDTTGESSHIIVYLWNGTFLSNVGIKSAPDQERENVDRAIWGTVTANTGSDGKLVGKCDYTFTSTTDGGWQEITVPIEYIAGAGEPTMMNTIISGGDYWTRDNVIAGTTLLADDVKFIYYSRLNDLKVGGVSVEGFNSDTYSYTMSGSTLPAESDIEVSHMGVGASHTVIVDADAATVTIKVTNAGNDVDGLSEHSYVLQYEKAAVENATYYPGYLNVYSSILGGDLVVNQSNTVTIIDNGDGTCKFILPDFRLDPTSDSLGDITVDNVTMTTENGVTTYNGSVDGMALSAGSILADVVLTGTITDAGKVNMNISVDWTNSGIYESVPIYCTFTSETTAIESIEINNENVPVEYYNLQGVKVANPENGVFIRVQGGKASKIVL